MTGAGGVTVAQAASVLASSSPQAPKLSLVAVVDRLSPLEAGLLGQADLLERSRVLGITPHLVPLVCQTHPGQQRQTVCQKPRGQASGGRREPR